MCVTDFEDGEDFGVAASSFVDFLPHELTVRIFQYLDRTSLCRASETCRAWKDFIDDKSSLWRTYCQRIPDLRMHIPRVGDGKLFKAFLSKHVMRCKVKNKWLAGEFSELQGITQLEREKLVSLSVEDWCEILQAEETRKGMN